MGKTTTTPANAHDNGPTPLLDLAWWGCIAYFVAVILNAAYRIRCAAIDEYGPVIHEFDPYFNFRATEYLYEHGAAKFFTWFDYMVWYPLGRPVGSTIYPGMQFVSVFIKRYILPDWSLNDVCVYVPTWFGVLATIVTGLIAYECSTAQNTNATIFQYLMDIFVPNRRSNSNNNNTQKEVPYLPFCFQAVANSPCVECAVFSMAMMSIVPAHLMRSVGGGYDNESVATTAMVLTFYCWVRSLRNEEGLTSAVVFGSLAGLAYFFMVATWGGYIFVINLVGVHAAMLVGLGRFSTKAWVSYSLFYTIGTLLAIQVPVVGWTPLKSLEQLGPCAVFFGYQVLQFCDVLTRRNKLTQTQSWKLRIQVFSALGIAVILFVYLLAPSGYFGPLSSRVRGLFVQHTRTGNPLVDSVAEHQPASSRAYFQYLHHVCSLAPVGYLLIMFNLSDSSSFLLAWGTTAYFFSHKMVRLILLTAPIGSILGGIAAGRMFAWCIQQWFDDGEDDNNSRAEMNDTVSESAANGNANRGKDAKKRKNNVKKGAATTTAAATAAAMSKSRAKSTNSSFDGLLSIKEVFDAASNSREGLFVKRTLAVFIAFFAYIIANSFIAYCWRLSHDLSNPSIIVQGRLRDGSVVKVDDYREAYWWLRDNTPEDSRIMAWWDYGYQITAISNRTTIADGNTWNHEHIALLGMALTTNIDDGYEIARHLADYVLVWAGGGGDDLAKSPHLARIANSVYREHCPGDPSCRAFGFIDNRGTPSPMMGRSFLFNLHGHKIRDGVEVSQDQFEEVFRSKYGKVRIYKIVGVSQESKDWVADPANRKCDAPGSWFCPGQYPPGLSKILARKKDFAQLEDFNRGAADDEYTKQYFDALANPDKARKAAMESELKKMKEETRKNVDEIYNTWEDTEDTTLMWRLISSNQVEELRNILEEEPTLAFVRSKDGRGPMWWAFEQRNQDITTLLMKAGVPHTDRDGNGLAPVDLLKGESM